MKKFCIIFLSLFILGIATFGIAGGGFLENNSQKDGGRYATNAESCLNERDFLRIHIRADSNESAAQAVKYRVRDKVVEYLVPIIADCTSKEDAIEKNSRAVNTDCVCGEQSIERTGVFLRGNGGGGKRNLSNKGLCRIHVAVGGIYCADFAFRQGRGG